MYANTMITAESPDCIFIFNFSQFATDKPYGLLYSLWPNRPLGCFE